MATNYILEIKYALFDVTDSLIANFTYFFHVSSLLHTCGKKVSHYIFFYYRATILYSFTCETSILLFHYTLKIYKQS